MQIYRKLYIVFFMVLGIFLSTLPVTQAQDSSPDCLSCHDDILSNSFKFVHKPFAEEKCHSCHRFQFLQIIRHRYTFYSLISENNYSFRLKGFEPGKIGSHISEVYAFLPPTQGGVDISFPPSKGFSQVELMTESWNASTAHLEWQTQIPEYCLIEWSTENLGQNASCFHAKSPYSLVDFGITACYECHPKNSLGISHPVNIVPSAKVKEKMEKSNLPTGKDGLLLCITCHLPHAGDYQHLGQKVVSEGLCIACHPKEIYNPE